MVAATLNPKCRVHLTSLSRLVKPPVMPDNDGRACRWDDPSFEVPNCPIKQLLTFTFRSDVKIPSTYTTV